MIDRVANAAALAQRLHARQRDKRGVPYIEHLRAVAEILVSRWPDAPDHAVAAAWLHDTMEDCGVKRADLLQAGIEIETVWLVEWVTRPSKTQPYLAYIEQLARHAPLWARRIKLADNEHNSDPARAIPGSDLVETRYAPARVLLEVAEARRVATA